MTAGSGSSTGNARRSARAHARFHCGRIFPVVKMLRHASGDEAGISRVRTMRHRGRLVCGKFWGKTGPSRRGTDPIYTMCRAGRTPKRCHRRRATRSPTFRGSGKFCMRRTVRCADPSRSLGDRILRGGRTSLVLFDRAMKSCAAGDDGFPFTRSGKPLQEQWPVRPIVMNTQEHSARIRESSKRGTFL